MAEQIIDIRERIEKMRIKFEDDHKSDIMMNLIMKKMSVMKKKKKLVIYQMKLIIIKKKILNLMKTMTYQNQKL